MKVKDLEPLTQVQGLYSCRVEDESARARKDKNVMIVRTGFVKGDPAAAQARLVAHLKYVEHWRRTENESRDDCRIFTKDEDQVTRSAAVQDVMNHANTQVAYHKIVLSPGEDEPITDWRKWTRGVMDDLEKKQGRELHWYAVKHDNTYHSHVHVVLAGTGDNQISGKREAVKMYRSDYELLRQSGIDRSDRDWSRQIKEGVPSMSTLLSNQCFYYLLDDTDVSPRVKGTR